MFSGASWALSCPGLSPRVLTGGKYARPEAVGAEERGRRITEGRIARGGPQREDEAGWITERKTACALWESVNVSGRNVRSPLAAPPGSDF